MPGIQLFGCLVLEANHPVGPREVLDECHEILAMDIGERLADRGHRPGIGASHHGVDDLVAEQLDDLCLAPKAGRPLTRQRIRAGAPVSDLGEALIGIGPHPPQDTALAQRDPLVAKGDLGQLPALVLRPDSVLGRDANVGEEGLVEVVAAGHLNDLADLDAGRRHVQDEVRDSLVLGRCRVCTG